MWIHEHKDWPNFTWDKEIIASKLIEVRHQQGRLLGKIEGLGFELRQEANLRILIKDVVNSASIEGEHLDTEEVRSSIARRLGIDIAGLVHSSRDVDGMVEMMLDATQQFDKPLSFARLFDWNASLFPTGRSGMYRITVGDWRSMSSGPMQVVSGPMGREKVHFEAPRADRIEKEMLSFFTWFESGKELDPVLLSGIAHLWFVTIHPFEDGNGRIGRAIADMALARADGMPERFYSLSTQIESERKDYYLQLEKQQRSNPEITNWLSWFLDCLKRAIINAEKILNKVLFKAQLWRKISHFTINKRQQFIINCMLEDNFKGYMNSSKYSKLAKCSTDTALRDIKYLNSKGILIKNPARGRSTSYRLIMSS